MSVVMFGGFEVNMLGMPIRARTPMRMVFQFVAAAGLLLAVSPRVRQRAALLVAIAGGVLLLCHLLGNVAVVRPDAP